jgi:hypothetical protein
MLLKIKTFVSSQGGLLPDADLSAYAALMQGFPPGTEDNSIIYNINDPTSKFLRRTMLLTVLLNANNGQPPYPTGYQRLSDCEPFMLILNSWLVDAVKESSPILLKILDLLGVLPLTVQHLKEYKTGRLIKKIAKGEEPKGTSLNLNQLSEIKNKAEKLFERWSNLVTEFEQAQAEELKRDDESKKKRRPSADSVSSVDAPPSAQPVIEESKYAQRITQIVERSHTNVNPISETVSSSRPLSADEIHKAKKKKMYLEMASSSSGTAATNLFNKRSTPVQEEIKSQTTDEMKTENAAANEQGPKSHFTEITPKPIASDFSSELPPTPPQIGDSSQSQTSSDLPKSSVLPDSSTTNKDLLVTHKNNQNDVVKEDDVKKIPPQPVKKDLSSFLSSVASSTTQVTENPNLNKTKKKKRVSFPEDQNELVQIRIIERLESSDGEHTIHHDFHEADRREATFAFDQLSKSIQPDVAWLRPAKLDLPEDLIPAAAIDSEEMRKQESRTREKPSVGSGKLVMSENTKAVKISNASAALKIPTADATNQAPLVRPVPVNIPSPAKPSSSSAAPSIDPKLLSFLSSGSDLMRNLLGNK